MALVAPRPYVHSPGARGSSLAPYIRGVAGIYGNAALDSATPGTPGAPAASTTASPGGGPVDYQKLLASDPILGQALSGYNAQGVQNQAALTAAQQRALIQYGKIPGLDLAQYGVNGIDATTQQLASQNTAAGTSTVAALQRAYQQAQQGSDASLAARGILRSGAYGQHAAENLQGYNQAGYQADQQLLDYLQGIYSGYLQQQQALSGSASQATNDALLRIIQQIQAGLLTGGTGGGGGGGGQDNPPPPPPPVAAPTPRYVPGGGAVAS